MSAIGRRSGGPSSNVGSKAHDAARPDLWPNKGCGGGKTERYRGRGSAVQKKYQASQTESIKMVGLYISGPNHDCELFNISPISIYS